METKKLILYKPATKYENQNFIRKLIFWGGVLIFAPFVTMFILIDVISNFTYDFIIDLFI